MWAVYWNGEPPHFIIMKRILSVSFDEEIWDKLREMRNSSDYVNNLVTQSLNAGGGNEQICEYCGSSSKPLIWMMPDEKLACEVCEKQMVWKVRHSTQINIPSDKSY